MISFLRGRILNKTSSEVLIDCNGVGYGVNISLLTSEKLGNKGDIAELFINLVIQQELINLYGFADLSEKESFKLLISVPNVGYKTALSILSSLSPDELRHCIISGNLVVLQKLPGIGKKTAERMLVELKDKMLKTNYDAEPINGQDNNTLTIKNEAVAALVALGYTKVIAEKAVNKVLSDFKDSPINIELLIKKSLSFVLK